MRILLIFTLGFAGACFLSAYLNIRTGAWGLLLCLGLLGWDHRRFRIPALLLAGLGLGLTRCAFFETGYLAPALALDGRQAQATVTVIDCPLSEEEFSQGRGILLLEGKPYLAELFLEPEQMPEPGTRVRGTFRFSAGRTGSGSVLTLSQRGKLVASPVKSRAGLGAGLRGRLESRLDRSLTEDTAPFARALLLGDSSGLSGNQLWDLGISGIRHVVAVSGLHISILYGVIVLVTARRRWLTLLLGLPALILFAAVTGFSPSVVRAGLMAGLMMAAAALNREYDPLTALSAAVLLMTALNPRIVTSVGFQLSAASVLGILLFAGRLMDYFMQPFSRLTGFLRHLVRIICGSGAVSLSALSLVTPLCALYFGTVSLIGPLTNLLTLWAVAWSFWGLLGILVFGGPLLGFPVSLLIRYILGTAELLARFPLAAVYTESPWIRGWLVFAYLLGMVTLLGKRKHPGYFAGLTAGALVLAIALSWGLPRRDPFRVTVMDVGQGQCILLCSRGQSFLVDCGGTTDERAADLAARTLLSQGIRKLDGLILTHFDRDHVGGAPMLLTRVEAERIYLPEDERIPWDPRITQVKKSTEIPLSDGKLQIFGGGDPEIPNEMSLCVLFEGGNCDILITGDRSTYGEGLLLEQTVLPRVDYLVAGHHGAESSTGQALLSRVRPETVIISAGKGNRYGHPAPETLFRLRQWGCRVLRTDQAGTILIRR